MNDLVEQTTGNAIAEDGRVQDMNPMTLIDKAVASGAGVETMAALMDLQERWDAKQAKKAYVEALTAFKENPPELVKDRFVSYETKNSGRTEYTHASLSQVAKIVGQSLSKYGLSANWITNQDDGFIKVTCVLTHEAGHSESTSLQSSADTSGGKNSIQAIGSAVTYLQRYTLLAITGLATQDQDDDGIAAVSMTKEEYDEINELIDATGTDVDKFCAHFKVDDVPSIPPQKVRPAILMLKQKKRQMESSDENS